MAKIINAKKKFFGTDGIRGPISSKTSPHFILKLGWQPEKSSRVREYHHLSLGKTQEFQVTC